MRDDVNAIFKDGFYYRKAGVMVTDIKPATQLQLNIFNAEQEVKHSKLMTAIDYINKRYGSKQIMLAPTLTKGEWTPQQNHFNHQSKTLRFYSGMNPRYAPRVTPVSTPEESSR